MGDAMYTACLQGHIEVVNDMLAAGVKATKGRGETLFGHPNVICFSLYKFYYTTFI